MIFQSILFFEVWIIFVDGVFIQLERLFTKVTLCLPRSLFPLIFPVTTKFLKCLRIVKTKSGQDRSIIEIVMIEISIFLQIHTCIPGVPKFLQHFKEINLYQEKTT